MNSSPPERVVIELLRHLRGPPNPPLHIKCRTYSAFSLICVAAVMVAAAAAMVVVQNGSLSVNVPLMVVIILVLTIVVV